MEVPLSTQMPLWARCSKRKAEIKTPRRAVELAHQSFELNEHPPKAIVIFTDSKSVLQAIETLDLKTNDDTIFRVKAIHNLLSSYDIQVTLEWIPGHTHLKSNEYADKLAKEGAGKCQID